MVIFSHHSNTSHPLNITHTNANQFLSDIQTRNAKLLVTVTVLTSTITTFCLLVVLLYVLRGKFPTKLELTPTYQSRSHEDAYSLPALWQGAGQKGQHAAPSARHARNDWRAVTERAESFQFVVLLCSMQVCELHYSEFEMMPLCSLYECCMSERCTRQKWNTSNLVLVKK